MLHDNMASSLVQQDNDLVDETALTVFSTAQSHPEHLKCYLKNRRYLFLNTHMPIYKPRFPLLEPTPEKKVSHYIQF